MNDGKLTDMRITFLFALLFSFQAYAQDTYIPIKGRLIDRTTKEPVPYASIYIQGKTIGTTSNEDGKFVFYIPSEFNKDTLMISMIGYTHWKSVVLPMAEKENLIEMSQNLTLLNEVTVRASKKKLTAKEVVKKAVESIPENYPMKPFMLEGFFRDLQKENDKAVELLEAALRFRYKDYNPGFEDVEIVEVRRNYNKRHPINGTYDRQNSIFDLMEDNYVKHRMGPLEIKGWKFTIDSILAFNQQTVYKISGIRNENTSAILYIDSDDFSILKIELKKQMVNGAYYRRYLNLPDPYGLQETSFKIIFEFQKIDGLMYLKYQREEDSYHVFHKTTNEIILRQSFVKELFVNHVVRDHLAAPTGLMMNINKSVEGQAKEFNADFWKYYNAPMETAKDSKVIQELERQ